MTTCRPPARLGRDRRRAQPPRAACASVNEDAILTDPTGALWAVADGMGGHGHGDLAADLVIDAFARLPHGGAAAGRCSPRPSPRPTPRCAAAPAPTGSGEIGATVVALLIEGGARHRRLGRRQPRLPAARAGALERLTRDHSLVQELIDRGELGEAEAERAPAGARGHPRGRRAASGSSRPSPSSRCGAGDVLLLCSDGLTRCVPEAEIAAVLARARRSPAAACRALVEAALAAGAPDNVSAVVVRLGEGGAR